MISINLISSTYHVPALCSQGPSRSWAYGEITELGSSTPDWTEARISPPYPWTPVIDSLRATVSRPLGSSRYSSSSSSKRLTNRTEAWCFWAVCFWTGGTHWSLTCWKRVSNTRVDNHASERGPACRGPEDHEHQPSTMHLCRPHRIHPCSRSRQVRTPLGAGPLQVQGRNYGSSTSRWRLHRRNSDRIGGGSSSSMKKGWWSNATKRTYRVAQAVFSFQPQHKSQNIRTQLCQCGLNPSLQIQQWDHI